MILLAWIKCYMLCCSLLLIFNLIQGLQKIRNDIGGGLETYGDAEHTFRNPTLVQIFGRHVTVCHGAWMLDQRLGGSQAHRQMSEAQAIQDGVRRLARIGTHHDANQTPRPGTLSFKEFLGHGPEWPAVTGIKSWKQDPVYPSVIGQGGGDFLCLLGLSFHAHPDRLE
eukprot:scaffold1340_cov233-Amphora_coffeaeformis.AAC.8